MNNSHVVCIMVLHVRVQFFSVFFFWVSVLLKVYTDICSFRKIDRVNLCVNNAQGTKHVCMEIGGAKPSTLLRTQSVTNGCIIYKELGLLYRDSCSESKYMLFKTYPHYIRKNIIIIMYIIYRSWLKIFVDLFTIICNKKIYKRRFKLNNDIFRCILKATTHVFQLQQA